MVTIALAEGRNVATATGGNPPTTDGKFSIFFQLRQIDASYVFIFFPADSPLGNRLRAIQEGCPKPRRADSGLGQELQQLEQRAQKPHSLRGEHLPPTRRRVGTIRGGTPITHHGSKIILRHPIVLSTKRLSLSSFPSSDLLGRTLPTHLDLKGGGEAAAGTRWPVEES